MSEKPLQKASVKSDIIVIVVILAMIAIMFYGEFSNKLGPSNAYKGVSGMPSPERVTFIPAGTRLAMFPGNTEVDQRGNKVIFSMIRPFVNFIP